MKIAYVIIGAIVVAGLAGAGGFFGGMTYAQSQSQNTVSDFARQRAIQGGQTGGQGGANAASAANNPCGFGNFGGPGGFAGAGGGAPNSGANGTANGTTGNGGQGQGTNRRQGGQTGGAGGAFGGFTQLGNCVARGQIKAVNGDTVEISTAEKVVTVKVNDATVISKTDRGSIADLKAGDRVTVFSQETGDSPTASTIQLQAAPPTQQ